MGHFAGHLLGHLIGDCVTYGQTYLLERSVQFERQQFSVDIGQFVVGESQAGDVQVVHVLHVKAGPGILHSPGHQVTRKGGEEVRRSSGQ